jgi:DNA polymerase-3 subunit delta
VTTPVYLLQGEEFLAAEALDKIRAEAETDPLAESTFAASAPIAEILTALGTPNLLGGRRLVVVEGAHELKGDQVEAIERYLESPSPHTVLVLVGSGRTKLAAAIKRSGSVVTLDAPRGRRLASWIRERARAHRLQVDDRGAWALIDSVGTELRDLDGALAQMSSALGPARVSVEDVRRLFPRLADERIYALTDAIGERRQAAAMGLLRRLLEQGDEPLVLFGAVGAHLKRMLVARGLVEQGGTAAVAAALGLPDWRADRVAKQARSYREDELAGALQILAETDVEMKGGDLPPEIALERAVLEIVG